MVKFLGTTDDVTTCDCCGKANLKSTVALSIDDSDPVHYGSDCAAQAIGRDVKEVRKETRKADRANESRAAEAKARAEREAAAPWFTFLAVMGKGDDTFRRIESLGGYKAAREAFKASVYFKT